MSTHGMRITTALLAVCFGIAANAEFDPERDLISLHYDHAPDRDDGQSAAADATILGTMFPPRWVREHVVAVSGCYGKNRDRFNPASDAVMRAAWDDRGGWIGAHGNRKEAVLKLVERWGKTLRAGGDVWVKEGGQSDLTVAVLLTLQRKMEDLDARQRIHVVQHSDWNEQQTTERALAYLKQQADYIRIADANRYLNRKGGDPGFVNAATAHPAFGGAWKAAFAYYDPDERLDFSDTGELLHILGLGEADIDRFQAWFLPASSEQAGERLPGDYRFTEGPAADRAGNVYFTDVANNRIHRWNLGGTVSVFRENSGGANGLAFDRRANLYICEGANRRVVKLSPRGEQTVVADRYNGKPFNRPNDLWVDSRGGVYFTDPVYGPQRDALRQDGEHVYYVPPESGEPVRVIDDMVRPNGLVGTPDGTTLYVADHGAGKVFAYRIESDGALSNRRLFAPVGCDGMTLDALGRVYLTSYAVMLFGAEGRAERIVTTPERPTNVCLGGRNGSTLFVTARTSVYAADLRAD